MSQNGKSAFPKAQDDVHTACFVHSTKDIQITVKFQFTVHVIPYYPICISPINTSCRKWLHQDVRCHYISASSSSVSFPLYCRVMSVCVTPAGRGSSANEKLMNVYRSPAKTTPPAQTFSTATSRCARRLEGAVLTRCISHLINAEKGSRSETAICPSTGRGDNELQMAGKTNESINGSQHEKVSGDLWIIGGKSWCICFS